MRAVFVRLRASEHTGEAMQDDLFRPTIAEPAPSGRPPWRPESIAYPAFFGGPLGAALLGVLNGRRLALPGRTLLLVAVAGLAGFAGRAAVTAVAGDNSVIRLAGSVTGLLVWAAVLAAERGPFRVAQLRGTEPASLVGAGFAAAIGCGLLEVVLLLAVVR
jgi:hypothetical protein